MVDEEPQTAPAEEKPRPSGKDVPPSITRVAFCCPHCGAYTHQYWYTLYVKSKDKDSRPFVPDSNFLSRIKDIPDFNNEEIEFWEKRLLKFESGKVFLDKQAESVWSDFEACNLHLSRCFTCDEFAVWVHNRLLYPPQRTGPEPNEDLPETVKTDYEEARSILNLSPRGAAALLRLCVEKLCIHLKAVGSTLDDQIGDLVKKGLSVRVQQSLDAVRVIGNEAVHPGQMDLKDNPETAETLFMLVNVITEKMISEQKHVEAVYASLSPSKRDAIERRDKESQ